MTERRWFALLMIGSFVVWMLLWSMFIYARNTVKYPQIKTDGGEGAVTRPAVLRPQPNIWQGIASGGNE